MFRRTPWALVTLLVFSHVITTADETDNPWIRGIFTGKSPRLVALAETDAWQRATALAERTPDAFVLVGSGRSMEPLYPPGTILVLQEYPYELLESGQTALYRNRNRRIVAHVLVARGRDGWRATGLNNRRPDTEPVSATNLVGVVIAAFQPLPAPRTPLATTRH